MLLLAIPSFGQTANTAQNTLTADEQAKIREGAEAVLKYIQTQQNIDSAAIARGGINIPDVVDKALDKFGGAVTVVYDNVKKTAPQVWSVMLLQQYAKAISGLLGPILWLVMIIFIYKFMNRHWKAEADDVWNSSFGTSRAGFWFRWFFTKFAPLLAGFITCITLFVQAKTSVLLFMNPEYYAIRDLLTMLLGSSHGM